MLVGLFIQSLKKRVKSAFFVGVSVKFLVFSRCKPFSSFSAAIKNENEEVFQNASPVHFNTLKVIQFDAPKNFDYLILLC
jgi:hypothetical protein